MPVTVTASDLFAMGFLTGFMLCAILATCAKKETDKDGASAVSE